MSLLQCSWGKNRKLVKNCRNCETAPFAFQLIARTHPHTHTRAPRSCTVDVLSDPLLNAANREPGINLMLRAGQRMVEKKRGRWHQWFLSSSVSELPFSLGYQSIPLSPLISLRITSFLVPSVHSSVSLLIPFFPPFQHRLHLPVVISSFPDCYP